MKDLMLQEVVENKIYLIRGQKVMLDKDLASLYEVDPRALRQQVKRNKERFPGDFMFQLTEEELSFMVSQNVTPSRGVKGTVLGVIPEPSLLISHTRLKDFMRNLTHLHPSQNLI